ncbi:MAG: RNA methyltransferase [Acidimicrobiia bacterium]|nr:MAG: RNA methyltransferase [Acidimicrobiia bacterium]
MSRALDHLTIDEVIWCPRFGERPTTADVTVTSVSSRVFEKISRRQHPDGVAAVARTPDLSLESFHPVPPALILVADGVEKPGNIGAMLRTCDAFGAAFIGSELGTDIVNPNVVRSAQGSLFTIPIATASRAHSIEWCRTNTTIVVAHPEGDASLWQSDLAGPTTFVVGAEHSGVGAPWLEAGIPTLIPMAGVADSLNASVSAGVFLGEAVRQRSG